MLVAVRRTLLSKPEFVVLDTFTRPDSAAAMGNAETGQAWTAIAGTWGISSNEAYSASDANIDRVELDSGIADGIIECTMRGVTNAAANYEIPYLTFRGNGTNYLMVYEYNGNLYLLKYTGAQSVLGSVALTINNDTPFTVRVIMLGNALTVFVDGVSKITYTLSGGDTVFNAYTRVGLALEKVGTPATPARWDNFTVQGGLP